MRTMVRKVLRIILVLVMVCNVYGKCGVDEIEQAGKCERCPVCPPGFGLEPQCGGEAGEGIKIQCVPCKDGLTYSAENSTASCEPCQTCYNQKTLRNCTATQGNVCSKKCRDGYQKDVDGFCEKVDSPTQKPPTSRPITIQPTPPTNIFTEPDDTQNHSTPTSATIQPTPPINTGFTASPNDTSDEESQEPTSGKGFTVTDILVTSISISISVTVVVILIVYGIYKKGKIRQRLVQYLRRRRSFSGPENIPMQPRDPITSWTDYVLLKKIPPDLSRMISIEISTIGKRNWRDIGHGYEVDETDLNCMGLAYLNNTSCPGEELLKYFNSAEPNLTLTDFINSLKKIKRQDVIEKILKYHDESEV